ncbi:MAG: beta-galactosidase, partial [Alphaproteobacteria bacterium]|nr:beta-galactosidase [Alphaproteobacteria bacterium]
MAADAGLKTRDLPDGVRLRRHGGHVFALNYGETSFDLTMLGWSGEPLLGELVLAPSRVAVMAVAGAGY